MVLVAMATAQGYLLSIRAFVMIINIQRERKSKEKTMVVYGSDMHRLQSNHTYLMTQPLRAEYSLTCLFNWQTTG